MRMITLFDILLWIIAIRCKNNTGFYWLWYQEVTALASQTVVFSCFHCPVNKLFLRLVLHFQASASSISAASAIKICLITLNFHLASTTKKGRRMRLFIVNTCVSSDHNHQQGSIPYNRSDYTCGISAISAGKASLHSYSIHKNIISSTIIRNSDS